MKMRSKFFIGLFFVFLLSGCSNPIGDELSDYVNEEVLGSYNEFIEEGSAIEEEFIVALEAGRVDDVLDIATEEYIPLVERTLKQVESYDSEFDEINELNDLLVGRTLTLKERLQAQNNAFQLLTEMESDEDLVAAIASLDKVIEHSNEYINYQIKFEDMALEMIDEYGLDEDLIVPEPTIPSDQVEDAVYNETGWFVAALGYEPDILITGELGETTTAINSSNELEVQLTGKVLVDEELVVQGESNLPEGAELEAVVHLHGTKVSDGHKAYTNEDGTFEITIPDLGINDGEIELQVKFRPANQNSELQELYGEKGEHMVGDFIYLYSSAKRSFSEAMMIAHFTMSKKGEVSFEIPEWNRPDDYGELDIWMEVEEFTDHDTYYDLFVRSNLVEGTLVQGDIEIPGYESAGFIQTADVLPDGSFSIRMQAPDVDDEVYMLLEVLPGRLYFSYTEELYGENGEYFQGDLVEKHKDGNKISFPVLVDEFLK